MALDGSMKCVWEGGSRLWEETQLRAVSLQYSITNLRKQLLESTVLNFKCLPRLARLITGEAGLETRAARPQSGFKHFYLITLLQCLWEICSRTSTYRE